MTITPAPKKKTPIWLIVVGVVVLGLAGLGIIGAITNPAAGAAHVTAPPAGGGKPDSSKIADFEEAQGIDTAKWYPHIDEVTIQSGALWVATDLSETGEAKKVASSICGSYSLYTLDDATVTVVLVRAKSGVGLAKCGPGA